MRQTWSYVLALALVTTFAAGSSPLTAGPFPASSPGATAFQDSAEMVTATEQKPNVPYQTNITIKIANGSNVGSANGVLSGTQAVLIPAGKRLIVQTVSMYRFGAGSNGSTVQIFMNANAGGTYASSAVPPATNTGATVTGATFNGTFYADGGTELEANAFRTNKKGAETVTVSVTGYLVSK
jgi:hypothetical protein